MSRMFEGADWVPVKSDMTCDDAARRDVGV